jgi:hypothetical protein
MTPQFTKALVRWGTQPAAEIDAAAERLNDEAQAASKLRGYQRNPDVAALTVEHTRERSERVLMTAMTAGLLYTTVNVHDFLAGPTASWLVWLVSWLVEPAITAGWLALMRMEQVARRNRETPDGWVRWARWAALAVTYTFNSWDSWLSHSPRQIVTHSAIPFLVFCFAEGLTSGRDALTRAAEYVARRKSDASAEQTQEPEVATVPAPEVLPAPVIPPAPIEPADSVVTPLRTKGFVKNTLLPQVLRTLRDQGRTPESITTTEVDTLLGTNKYVTRAMINSAWPAVDEETDDGAING